MSTPADEGGAFSALDLCLQITRAERTALRAAASREGRSVGSYVRRAAVAQAERDLETVSDPRGEPGQLGPHEVLRFEVAASRGGLPPGAAGMAPATCVYVAREVTQPGPGPWRRIEPRSVHRARAAIREALWADEGD